MIVAKFLNAAHNLVEQKDIKETVIGASTSEGYNHTITCTVDPTTFDYLILYLYGSGSKANNVVIAKYYNGAWYTTGAVADYRYIAVKLSSSGKTLTANVCDWIDSKTNAGGKITRIVGVNRGRSLAKIFNWLAPRRKVVLAC